MLARHQNHEVIADRLASSSCEDSTESRSLTCCGLNRSGCTAHPLRQHLPLYQVHPKPAVLGRESAHWPEVGAAVRLRRRLRRVGRRSVSGRQRRVRYQSPNPKNAPSTAPACARREAASGKLPVAAAHTPHIEGDRFTMPSSMSISPSTAFAHVGLPAPPAPISITRSPLIISRSRCRKVQRPARRMPGLLALTKGIELDTAYPSNPHLRGSGDRRCGSQPGSSDANALSRVFMTSSNC